tara:strand:- start:407 stop:601 length:195 start_codon:yes stop_codon:yes gene_type:complete
MDRKLYGNRKMVSKSGSQRGDNPEVRKFGKNLDIDDDLIIDVCPLTVIMGPNLIFNPRYIGRKN